MTHKKINLPKKICQGCNKEFQWRKRWRNNWEQVIYCSERCRRKGTAKNVL